MEQDVFSMLFSTPSPGAKKPQTLDEVKRGYVEAIVRLERGNLAAVSRTLGVDRRTLYRWVEKWQLEIERP